MKPTVEEQLSGTCTILEDVVAPHVDNPYAAEVLRGLVANLRMLASAVPNLGAFVNWDNAATEDVLRSVGLPAASGPLHLRIDAELAEPADDPLDWAATAARNDTLRSLLSRVINECDLTAAAERRIATHLAQRAARSPIRYATAIPTAGT